MDIKQLLILGVGGYVVYQVLNSMNIPETAPTDPKGSINQQVNNQNTQANVSNPAVNSQTPITTKVDNILSPEQTLRKNMYDRAGDDRYNPDEMGWFYSQSTGNAAPDPELLFGPRGGSTWVLVNVDEYLSKLTSSTLGAYQNVNVNNPLGWENLGARVI